MLRALSLIAALATAPSGLAAETLATAGDIEVSDGYAFAAGPAARSGAVYLRIANAGDTADRLMSAQSGAAQMVQVHTSTMENGIARMLPLEGGVEVPAGGSLSLEQGSTHLMLMGLTAPFDPQGSVTLTLVFEQAGEVEVEVPVETSPVRDHGG